MNYAPLVHFPAVEELVRFDPYDGRMAERGLFALADNPLATRPLNLLRAQVLKRAAKAGARLIGVTSAAPDAGKSFVTSNLAGVLSRIPGLQVLLLDLDLRRPSVAERFGMEVEVGLDAWLTGRVDDLRVIGRQLGDSGLSIYPAARCDEGASELLTGPRFEALIQALRRLPETAVVLCDLPPAFVSDDALSAIGKLDGYIHVIEEGVTPKRQVEELRRLMDPAPCLGAVLNRYGGRWNDSYGYAAARKYSRYYDTKD